MIRKRLGFLFLAAAAVITVGCVTGNSSTVGEISEISDLSQLPKNKWGYADVTAEQLQPLVEGKDFLLVNVNSSAAEIIPGTDFTIPFDQIEENLDLFPRKDQPTVLYCQAGGLSRSAVLDLVELGFTNIIWLNGGINAWKRADFDVETR
jgi:rhodanese-related sulfurtransferase